MDADKKITLVSSDGEKVEISSKAVQRSVLVKGIIEDYPDDAEVPLNNVKSNILKKIKEYLEHYENTEPKEIERPLPSQNFKECVDEWDNTYIDVELDLIFELILGANYMDIKPLLELASAKVASIIKGKTTEEIRKTFGITNDFTPEEEQQIIEDYPDDAEVPLNNVKSNILKKIKEYLEHYENTEPKEIERPLPSQNFKECVDEWDNNYIEVDLDLIFELILGANYMDIKPLLELASAKVASIIKGKTTEEIRKTFGITNDFTPEEEQQIIEENKWCMENL